MGKLLNILLLTLAINFVIVMAVAFWLYSGGYLNKEKVAAIHEVMFPTPTTAPTSQPAAEKMAGPTSRPSLKLEELLARHAGLPASEQAQFIRMTFDSQMAQSDRRYRELVDLQRQVDLAKQQLSRDRMVVEQDRKDLENRIQEATRLANDKGFQDSLSLYISMPSKQAKLAFLSMEDEKVVQFLQAMESRQAAKILKEFKSPEEQDRLKKILERLREQQASAKG